MTRRMSSAARLFLLLSIALIPWAELLLTTGVPCYRDAGRYFMPDKIALASALRSGAFPFWDGSRAAGLPWFGDFQTQLFYPAATTFHLLPVGPAIRAFAGLHVIAAAAGALLAFTAWGVRAATLGALVLAMSGFCRTSLDTLTTFSAFAWIPYVLLFTLGGETRDRMILGGVSLACLTLAGIPDQALLGVAGLAALGGWRLGRRPGWVILGMLPALPQMIQGVEFVTRSDRWLAPAAGASTIWSIRFADLSGWFVSLASRPESVAEYWRHQHWLDSPYLGLTTGLLIAAAVALGRAPAMRPGYWPALALFLALSLGGNGPVWEGAGTLIPGLGAVRYPVKAASWLTWLLAWLAAASATRIAGGRARGTMTVLAFAVAADLLWLGPGGPALIPSSYYTATARLDPELRAAGGRVVIEPRTFHDLEVLAGPSLQSALWSAREFRPPNLHRLANLDSFQTYGSMDLAGHSRFIDEVARMALGPAISAIRQAGVRSVVSAGRLTHPDLIPASSVPEIPLMYALRDPWPTVRLAARPALDSRPVMAATRVRVMRSGWYRIHVDSDRALWVVAAENWYPGWAAVIQRTGGSGAPPRMDATTPVMPFGQVMAVPPGNWEITLRYVPRGFGGSAGLAAAALAAMAWLGTKRMTDLVGGA